LRRERTFREPIPASKSRENLPYFAP
jgi:hypothetical protein